ncbi:adenylate/guanylate cyclase domain-containing protein [Mycobacterium hodleri]|uniref:Adenylate/guanylate cyclase domain-containing protein n=2 Tax=Mycolicibacterium hodleri TaxID=49897 RepID=A0A502DS17_9MYCO|nr:adenylate/guanylate cyclase domain-containing protein [Mycolicibacterium hodleri]
MTGMSVLGRIPRVRTLGFQSKLLVMLLTVSVISVLIAGAIGYVSGTNSLRTTEYQRLTQLRESRAREITAYYRSITNGASIVTHGATAVGASRDFNAAFAELQTAPLPAGAQAAVSNYYQTIFGPQLAKATGKDVDATLFEPTSNAAIYLQNAYTVPAQGDFDAALKVNATGDPSAWSAANARYQPFFADLTSRFGFEDSLILNTTGDVVYSAYKGTDLGTNLLTGPYKTTKLADTYREAVQAVSVDETFVSDFERYAPSYGKPTPWVLTPIGSGGVITGVLALQLSIDQINDVMTGNEGWESDGLGKSGETYLAGPDKLMRSVSRELLTDPTNYAQEVVANGTPEDVAAREVDVKGSVLLQPVDTLAVNRALVGESGVTTAADYIGPEALVAYMPLDIPGLEWVLVAKVDESEALAPVNDFARNIALSIAAIVLAVCLIGLLFSRIFTRPLTRLADAVRRVSGGERGVAVPVTTKDEIGDLGAAFNDMSNALEVKQELLDEQRRENDELLASLMPETVARRYREGEETISSDFRDVTVIYAELVGFDAFSRATSSDDSVGLLNSIIEGIDEAAERHGIERVRHLHNGFLATCGLVVPRVDHASRTVAFASELTEIIERSNYQHEAQLAIRAGIDSGAVSSGLIGQRSKVYDLWGEAVDLAHRVHAATNGPGVFVSSRVHDALDGIYAFTESGTVPGERGSEPIWSLDLTARRV